ncbi:hypothetical protein [Streptomyces milbemycinicus]|uniref:Uncharacterized protein n=1 Tax=Streptomyces milbemycinicus TaxID=476552 RepID=A0ABW8LW89_9ACTN
MLAPIWELGTFMAYGMLLNTNVALATATSRSSSPSSAASARR